MGFFEWHGKIVRSVSKRQLTLGLLGRTFVVFSLGSLLSLHLDKYGYWILILATLMVVKYVNDLFVAWQQNKKVEYKKHLFGSLGSVLLILFLGIQSSQVSYKIVILLLGFICIAPAAVALMKKRFG